MFICSCLLLRAWEAGTPLPSFIVQVLCSAKHPQARNDTKDPRGRWMFTHSLLWCWERLQVTGQGLCLHVLILVSCPCKPDRHCLQPRNSLERTTIQPGSSPRVRNPSFPKSFAQTFLRFIFVVVPNATSLGHPWQFWSLLLITHQSWILFIRLFHNPARSWVFCFFSACP